MLPSRLIRIFGLATIALACSSALLRAEPDPPDAIMVEMADLHSAYDRMPQILALMDAIFADHPTVPHAILVDGDLFEAGNVVGRRSGGTIEFAFLRALARRGPTVLNLGNHEPEYFGMAETVARIRATGVVVIGGTIKDRAAGQPFAPSATELRIGDLVIRIVGFATNRLTTFRASVRPTLMLDDPVDWASRNLTADLRAAPIAVVLSHAGLAADRRLLPLVPDGTLYVGAHDHLRFVQKLDRTVYFQAGSWGAALAIIQLRIAPQIKWSVALAPIPASGPADAELSALVQKIFAGSLTPEETAIVGRSATALDPDEAARFATEAARRAAEADVTVIGATTFGAGLPEGPITRYALDACVRFDGPLYGGRISGEALLRLKQRANQGPDTPFAQRLGENLVLVGPTTIDAGRTYRLVTTDWVASKPELFLGPDAPRLTKEPNVTLKAAVIAALQKQP